MRRGKRGGLAGILAEGTRPGEAQTVTTGRTAGILEEGEPGLANVEEGSVDAVITHRSVAASAGWMLDPAAISPEFAIAAHMLVHVAIRAGDDSKARDVAIQGELPVRTAAEQMNLMTLKLPERVRCAPVT